MKATQSLGEANPLWKQYAERSLINKMMIEVSRWRGDAQGIGDKVVRRVVCGFALAGLSIAALIDGVVSLALAILLAPSLIFGSDLSFDFAKRAVKEIWIGYCGITLYQIKNIFCDSAITSPAEERGSNLEPMSLRTPPSEDAVRE